MMLFLYNLPSYCMGLIVVGTTVLVVFVGYSVFSRLGLVHADPEQRAMALSMVSIITTINSLLVAFAAVSVWDAYNDADRTVAAEAACAGELARDLAAFDSATASKAGNALQYYLESVIRDEWPTMQQHLQPAPETETAFNRLFDIANDINPTTPRQTVLLNEVLKRTNEMAKLRQQRLLTLEVSMPGTLWAVMLIASGLSFLLLYLFPPTPFYVGLISTWSTTLGLAFFFVLAVDRPYAGEVSVSSSPYRKTIDQLVDSRIWFPLTQAAPSKH